MLIKRWQLDQIVFRHLFDGLSCFAPSGETAGDNECTKALFSQ